MYFAHIFAFIGRARKNRCDPRPYEIGDFPSGCRKSEQPVGSPTSFKAKASRSSW